MNILALSSLSADPYNVALGATFIFVAIVAAALFKPFLAWAANPRMAFEAVRENSVRPSKKTENPETVMAALEKLKNRHFKKLPARLRGKATPIGDIAYFQKRHGRGIGAATIVGKKEFGPEFGNITVIALRCGEGPVFPRIFSEDVWAEAA